MMIRSLSRRRPARRSLSEVVAEAQSETAPRRATCRSASIGTRAVSESFSPMTLLYHNGYTTAKFVYPLVKISGILCILYVEIAAVKHSYKFRWRILICGGLGWD